ncbi:hypothetical protein LZ554_008953 [Drepanopeziza brunnea f. sp. 'monogermtubi']|nr:hypothetical protein LZ554_008953 [Drepanopeziza brunnea f. sp. 'monogermtubi']
MAPLLRVGWYSAAPALADPCLVAMHHLRSRRQPVKQAEFPETIQSLLMFVSAGSRPITAAAGISFRIALEPVVSLPTALAPREINQKGVGRPKHPQDASFLRTGPCKGFEKAKDTILVRCPPCLLPAPPGRSPRPVTRLCNG